MVRINRTTDREFGEYTARGERHSRRMTPSKSLLKTNCFLIELARQWTGARAAAFLRFRFCTQGSNFRLHTSIPIRSFGSRATRSGFPQLESLSVAPNVLQEGFVPVRATKLFVWFCEEGREQFPNIKIVAAFSSLAVSAKWMPSEFQTPSPAGCPIAHKWA